MDVRRERAEDLARGVRDEQRHGTTRRLLDQPGPLPVGEDRDGPGLQRLGREPGAVGGPAGQRGPELTCAGPSGVEADPGDRLVDTTCLRRGTAVRALPAAGRPQPQVVALREVADRQRWGRHGPEATVRPPDRAAHGRRTAHHVRGNGSCWVVDAGTPSAASAALMILWNTGAAVAPPKIAAWGPGP